MPDTPIDLSEGIQSVRLKVPTAEVPIPPEGFAQLHSPAPGELALRLPDGSVVAIGGGDGGGGAPSFITGPGGFVNAAQSDPGGILIKITHEGDVITLDGPVQDAAGRLYMPPPSVVPISSAELLALHVTPKVLVAAPGSGKTIVPLGGAMRFSVPPGGTTYAGNNPGYGPLTTQPYLDRMAEITIPGSAAGRVGWFPLVPQWDFPSDQTDDVPLVLSADPTLPLTGGNATLVVVVVYIVV